ncbi:uncharacterized protein A4U43_C09F15200 [Asparagus officinalis]|uniref:Uncharacterized protein n=1 Tax=Asparagus officinalis TaxID=4686 RepID=A0A5P1EB13_ASPOF|nr:uncharacterized protein A4U43_C09F15200 [Asparagus officinalis]
MDGRFGREIDAIFQGEDRRRWRVIGGAEVFAPKGGATSGLARDDEARGSVGGDWGCKIAEAKKAFPMYR